MEVSVLGSSSSHSSYENRTIAYQYEVSPKSLHSRSFPGIRHLVLSIIFGCLGFSGSRSYQSGAKHSSLDCRWEERVTHHQHWPGEQSHPTPPSEDGLAICRNWVPRGQLSQVHTQSVYSSFRWVWEGHSFSEFPSTALCSRLGIYDSGPAYTVSTA